MTAEQKLCLIQQDDKRLFGTWHQIHFLQEPGMKTKMIMSKMPTSVQWKHWCWMLNNHKQNTKPSRNIIPLLWMQKLGKVKLTVYSDIKKKRKKKKKPCPKIFTINFNVLGHQVNSKKHILLLVHESHGIEWHQSC